jgi:hypothetical protein
MPGAIPTLNGRGFMLEALDRYALAFAEHAAGGRKVRRASAGVPEHARRISLHVNARALG